jgi:hypothetical protein
MSHRLLICACGKPLDLMVEDGVTTIVSAADVVREHGPCLARARESATTARP